jgi:PAS domain S-box-containing protein
MHYSVYVWPLLLSGAMLIVMAAYSLRFRDVPAATPFRSGVLLGALWAWSYALDVASDTLSGKYWAALFGFPAVAFLAVVWLAMALQYTGRGAWLTRQRLVLLLIIPAITSVVNATGGAHHLFRYNLRLAASGPFTTLLNDVGPWWWVFVGYTYALFLAVLFVLGRSLREAAPTRSRQTGLIMLGVILPLVTDMLFQAGITPFPGYDMAATMLFPAGALIGWALFRYRLFDIVPIARSTIIESMDDLVLVLDGHDRLLDLNAAAHQLLGPQTEEALGQSVDAILRPWPILLALYHGERSAGREVRLGDGAHERIYDVSVTPVYDREHRRAAQVLLLHDITPRVRAEEARAQVEREREVLITQLQEALANVRTLRGLVPICASCKRIRDDSGYWHQVEAYVRAHSEAEFSHGICPDCMRKLYPDYVSGED